jgi:hypothetical protein
MSDILRQVDEDLRKEKLSNLFKKYGLYAVSVIIVIVFTVIGYQLNVSISKSKNEILVETFINATNDNNFIKQIPLYEEIISSNNEYLSGLAALRTSNLQVQNGNIEEGYSTLEKIAENIEYDVVIRDLATYLLFMAKMEDPDDLASNLNLTNERIESSPFKYSFLEIIAVRKLILGDYAEAKKDFEDLISNLDLPIEIRNRAIKFIELS